MATKVTKTSGRDGLIDMAKDNPGIVVVGDDDDPHSSSPRACNDTVLSLNLQLPHNKLWTISDDSDWSVESDFSDASFNGSSYPCRRRYTSRSPENKFATPDNELLESVSDSSSNLVKRRNRQSFTEVPRALNHILLHRKKFSGSAPTSPVSDHRYCPLTQDPNSLSPTAALTFDEANSNATLSDSGGKSKTLRSLKSEMGRAFQVTRKSFHKTRRKSSNRSIPLSPRFDIDNDQRNAVASLFDFSTTSPSLSKLIKAGKSRIKSRSSVDDDEVGLYLSLVI